MNWVASIKKYRELGGDMDLLDCIADMAQYASSSMQREANMRRDRALEILIKQLQERKDEVS